MTAKNLHNVVGALAGRVAPRIRHSLEGTAVRVRSRICTESCKKNEMPCFLAAVLSLFLELRGLPITRKSDRKGQQLTAIALTPGIASLWPVLN
jgi:hypothetical protein